MEMHKVRSIKTHRADHAMSYKSIGPGHVIKPTPAHHAISYKSIGAGAFDYNSNGLIMRCQRKAERLEHVIYTGPLSSHGFNSMCA